MTGPVTPDAGRFDLVATAIAGRAIEVRAAPIGTAAHTDGRIIYVTAGATADDRRREVVMQSALMAAGSLRPSLVGGLRGRPRLARRYLAIEGPRALTEVAQRFPFAGTLCPGTIASSTSAERSLALARGRTPVPDPPAWFGVIKPGPPGRNRSAADAGLRFDAPVTDNEDGDDADGDDRSTGSRILKLFEAPAFTSRTLSEFLRKLLGSSASDGEHGAGMEARFGTARRGRGAAPQLPPHPVPIRFADSEKPGVAVGFGGALFPEWDVHNGRYRQGWCRVVDFPVTAAESTPTLRATDDVLRRRLSRIGLGHRMLRRRPDGDELDTDALIDLLIDMRSGHSVSAHIYTERRKVVRDLSVLILLDASGSTTDTDAAGHSAHDRQRQAAAVLTTTLEELGDRVALYGFRSEGRHAVYLPMIKNFDRPFGVIERRRLDGLRARGYTRLGAGIRGAAEILKTRAGTPNRLLVVLSDGFPYDDGYQGRYAEADTAKALEELRLDGIASLCLSIGPESRSDSAGRVFGPTGHAGAATLAELSPVMDRLFLSALREVTGSRPHRNADRTPDRRTRQPTR